MSKQPIKRMRATYEAWAIETALGTPRYVLKNSLDEIALYDNRREARFQLGNLKASFRLPMAARAVRVAVTVATIGRG